MYHDRSRRFPSKTKKSFRVAYATDQLQVLTRSVLPLNINANKTKYGKSKFGRFGYFVLFRTNYQAKCATIINWLIDPTQILNRTNNLNPTCHTVRFDPDNLLRSNYLTQIRIFKIHYLLNQAADYISGDSQI
uniref:Uncharacterized protein n=1 Tax=Rhizophagus irregularis (strain DAOM 181602 / DAOM 197198 / MUCL 43194) TaxID=747089 RepID=U9UMJ4_RHIID